MIYDLLRKYESLFIGKIGTCKVKHVDIKLQQY